MWKLGGLGGGGTKSRASAAPAVYLPVSPEYLIPSSSTCPCHLTSSSFTCPCHLTSSSFTCPCHLTPPSSTCPCHLTHPSSVWRLQDQAEGGSRKAPTPHYGRDSDRNDVGSRGTERGGGRRADSEPSQPTLQSAVGEAGGSGAAAAGMPLQAPGVGAAAFSAGGGGVSVFDEIMNEGSRGWMEEEEEDDIQL